MLYRASPESLYTIYIGYSAGVGKELRKRIKEWDIESARFAVTVIYIPSQVQAKAYEDDLIHYYAPPWNTRFSKQG